MATNGIISFGVEFPHFSASLFPTESVATYFDFAVAPYWADHDARLHGAVSWEMYSTGDNSETNAIIGNINTFVNENAPNGTGFVGNFVFVGNWREMHPYPAGASETQAEPFLTMVSALLWENTPHPPSLYRSLSLSHTLSFSLVPFVHHVHLW